MKKSSVIVVCFAALLLLGCAAMSEFVVRIRSISHPALLTGTNYVLLPGNRDISSDDQEFGQLAVYVRRTLSDLQYKEVETRDSADIIVLLSYGLDPSSIDLKHFAHPAVYIPDGALPVMPAVIYGTSSPLSTSIGLIFASSYPEVAPLITPVSTVYRRWLLMEAIDAHASEKVTLWKIGATERGYLPDLERLFPIMLAACKPFIGRTTDKIVEVILQEDDEQVKMIKGNSVR